MPRSTWPAADTLRRYVTLYRERHDGGLKQQDIAARCGYSPSMFAHLLAGSRRLASRDAVLDLAERLELDPAETNDLLARAGFASLQLEEVPAQHLFNWQQAEAIVKPVRQPDRQALAGVVQADIGALSGAWQYNSRLRERLYHRELAEISREIDTAIDQHYWPLRRAAARFFAHLHLAKAAALQGMQSPDEAERACREGLAAANLAKDPMSQCMINVRLADIAKLSGRFDSADQCYREALRILAGWENVTADQDEWRGHWWARIERKQGSLALFRGAPREALSALQHSAVYFEQHERAYEQAQVYHSMGWAQSLVGDWDSALSSHQKGLAIAETVNHGIESDDPRSFLQAYLYLAGTYLDRKDIDRADEWLTRAEKLSDHDAIAYHEKGRVYLQRGQILRRRQQWREAEVSIHRGIEFYEHKRDTVRLASAYNIIGGLHLFRNQENDASIALVEFERAIDFAQQSSEPNTHYLCAAHVLRCAALVRVEESTSQIDAAIKLAERLCRRGEGPLQDGASGTYYQHLARLKLIELRVRIRHADNVAVAQAATEALRAACQYNRFLLDEVVAALLAVPLLAEQRPRLLSAALQSLHELEISDGLLATHDPLLREQLKTAGAVLASNAGLDPPGV